MQVVVTVQRVLICKLNVKDPIPIVLLVEIGSEIVVLVLSMLLDCSDLLQLTPIISLTL